MEAGPGAGLTTGAGGRWTPGGWRRRSDLLLQRCVLVGASRSCVFQLLATQSIPTVTSLWPTWAVRCPGAGHAEDRLPTWGTLHHTAAGGGRAGSPSTLSSSVRRSAGPGGEPASSKPEEHNLQTVPLACASCGMRRTRVRPWPSSSSGGYVARAADRGRCTGLKIGTVPGRAVVMGNSSHLPYYVDAARCCAEGARGAGHTRSHLHRGGDQRRHGAVPAGRCPRAIGRVLHVGRRVRRRPLAAVAHHAGVHRGRGGERAGRHRGVPLVRALV